MPSEFHYSSQHRHITNHWSSAAVRRSNQISHVSVEADSAEDCVRLSAGFPHSTDFISSSANNIFVHPVPSFSNIKNIPPSLINQIPSAMLQHKHLLSLTLLLQLSAFTFVVWRYALLHLLSGVMLFYICCLALCSFNILNKNFLFVQLNK